MKKIVFALFAAFIATLFIITSFAHSGGTDSQGGHRGSGGYHYHHGYPAHQHYDMDGDGDKDCPYNFDDNTKYNGGGVAKTEKDKAEHKEETVATTKKEAPDKDAYEVEFDTIKLVEAIFGGALFFFWVIGSNFCYNSKHCHQIEKKTV